MSDIQHIYITIRFDIQKHTNLSTNVIKYIDFLWRSKITSYDCQYLRNHQSFVTTRVCLKQLLKHQNQVWVISMLQDSLLWFRLCIILISWKKLLLSVTFAFSLCHVLISAFFIRKYMKTKHDNASIKGRGTCPNLEIFDVVLI